MGVGEMDGRVRGGLRWGLEDACMGRVGEGGREERMGGGESGGEMGLENVCCRRMG